jgi:hypothetical protein
LGCPQEETKVAEEAAMHDLLALLKCDEDGDVEIEEDEMDKEEGKNEEDEEEAL